jgi:choline dehydrogenase-like flavoprotein
MLPLYVLFPFFLYSLRQVLTPLQQAYYAPCGCSNLVVLTNATVTKINLASKADHNGNFAATGATFSSYNKTYTVTATKEVIVSGGVYNTPQILELSGVCFPAMRPILELELLIE